MAVTCLVALTATAAADQWDDLAQKFVDQEHARLVRRTADNDGIVMVLDHPQISERVVLVVADKKPAMSFQFKSASLPEDDAFELMARGGSLVTGKDAATALRLLHQSYTAARAEKPGVATASSDGLSGARPAAGRRATGPGEEKLTVFDALTSSRRSRTPSGRPR